MKKDIEFPPVAGIHVAVVRNQDPERDFDWYVYLLNKNEYPIENLLVASRGYGYINNEKRDTSVLRHGFEWVDAQSSVLIEPIDPALFQLYNEYWVSYYAEGKLFDKKFIFVPESIIEENLVTIPLMNERGILHY